MCFACDLPVDPERSCPGAVRPSFAQHPQASGRRRISRHHGQRRLPLAGKRDNAAVKQWSAAQNAHARGYLDNLAARPGIKQRFQQLVGAGSVVYFDLQFRGGTLFAMKSQPPKQQPLLVAPGLAADPASEEKIIFDPNAASATGSIAVDFYVPSLDGKFVAVALSENGSEDSVAHVLEVATGKELPDRVPRVNFATAGGSLDWKADNSGFYYTRYPQGNERPPEDANFYQQVYFHKLGTDAHQDTYVIGKDFPRIAEIHLRTSDDGRWLIATVANGDGGQFAHYLMDAAGHWTQITRFEDEVVAVQVASDDSLDLLSYKNSPRGQILRLPLSRLDLVRADMANADLAKAEVIVPQSPGAGADENARASIKSFAAYGTPLRNRHHRRSLASARLRSSRPPARGSVPAADLGGRRCRLDRRRQCAVPLRHLSPAVGLVSFRRRERKVDPHRALPGFPYNFDDAEVVREFAVSKDGTRVPLNIIRRKGMKLDGSNPTLLYGYGGYGVSEKPFFAGSMARVFLDQGGVYVLANIRGGGEYGPGMARRGNLARRKRMSSTISSPVLNT